MVLAAYATSRRLRLRTAWDCIQVLCADGLPPRMNGASAEADARSATPIECRRDPLRHDPGIRSRSGAVASTRGPRARRRRGFSSPLAPSPGPEVNEPGPVAPGLGFQGAPALRRAEATAAVARVAVRSPADDESGKPASHRPAAATASSNRVKNAATSTGRLLLRPPSHSAQLHSVYPSFDFAPRVPEWAETHMTQRPSTGPDSKRLDACCDTDIGSVLCCKQAPGLP